MFRSLLVQSVTSLHLIIMSRKPGACGLSTGVILSIPSTRCNTVAIAAVSCSHLHFKTHACIDGDPPHTHTSCTVTANIHSLSNHHFPPQLCPAHLPLESPSSTGSRVFSSIRTIQ